MKQKIDRKKVQPLIDELKKFNNIELFLVNKEDCTSNYIGFYNDEYFYLNTIYITEFGESPLSGVADLLHNKVESKVEVKRLFGLLPSKYEIEYKWEPKYSKDEIKYVYNYFKKNIDNKKKSNTNTILSKIGLTMEEFKTLKEMLKN